MTPLTTITTIGTLIAPEGRLSVRKSGSWTAAWLVRDLPYRSRGRVHVACTASATGPDAAVLELADRMVTAARHEAIELAEGDEQDRAHAAEIRVAIHLNCRDCGTVGCALCRGAA